MSYKHWLSDLVLFSSLLQPGVKVICSLIQLSRDDIMSFQSSTSSGSGGWTKPPAVADSLGKRGEFAQNTDSSVRVREATSGAEV